jgi:hypothetical protein
MAWAFAPRIGRRPGATPAKPWRGPESAPEIEALMMTTPSVETDRPPEQALVPDRHNLFHEWQSGKIAFELWMYKTTGFILADPDRKFEVAGLVNVEGDRLSIAWRGAITQSPQPWLNAQRAIAARAYFEGPQ